MLVHAGTSLCFLVVKNAPDSQVNVTRWKTQYAMGTGVPKEGFHSHDKGGILILVGFRCSLMFLFLLYGYGHGGATCEAHALVVPRSVELACFFLIFCF